MKLYGYSERGVINAIFYEAYHKNKCCFFKELLESITLPYYSNPNFFKNPSLIIEEILIDQSFSSYFGTSDIVIIGKNQKSEKFVVFFEAKVKTEQSPTWNIKKNNSIVPNLFNQILLKIQLVQQINSNGQITFFTPKNKQKSIGKNKIVLKAVSLIKKAKHYFYITLTPDNQNNLNSFYNEFPQNLTNFMNFNNNMITHSYNNTTSQITTIDLLDKPQLSET